MQRESRCSVSVWGWCMKWVINNENQRSAFISVAVINILTKSNIGRKGFIRYIVSGKQRPEPKHLVSSRPQSKAEKKHPCLSCLYKARFLHSPREQHPAHQVVWSTVGWVFLHQLNQGNPAEACPQAWPHSFSLSAHVIEDCSKRMVKTNEHKQYLQITAHSWLCTAFPIWSSMMWDSQEAIAVGSQSRLCCLWISQEESSRQNCKSTPISQRADPQQCLDTKGKNQDLIDQSRVMTLL